MEGVSLENDDDVDDDSDVVEQSLMQLFADSSSDESDDYEKCTDPHVLVLTPGNMMGEDDVVMTDAETASTPAEACPAKKSKAS